MSARPSRGGGKRSYSDNVGSDSEDSTVSAPKLQSRRSGNKRQKSRPTATVDDEDGVDGDGDDDDSGTGRTTDYEAGQIVRVYVENFMCHRKFHFDLGRHLNFITGRNGSGKSAIAAAIQLCLGSSARHTGRGSNLGKYIREGSEDPAILEVTLLNEGPDAYKPEEYGARIIVKRVISKTGSTYHLLARDRSEVSRLRSELDKILKDFNIYVDTPCCILTQEESKRLIHGSAKEKYEFFIKATGLKHLHEELSVGLNHLAECEESMVRSKPQVLQLKSDFDLARKKAEDFAALDHIDEKIRIASAEVFWDEVRTIQGSLEALQEALTSKRERVAQAQEDYDAVAGNDGTAKDATLKALRGQVDATTTEVNQIAAQADAKRNESNSIYKQLSRNKSQLGDLERSRAEHVKRAKEVAHELKQMRDRAMQDADKEEREALDKIRSCELEIEHAKAAIQQWEKHRREVKDEVGQEQKELNRVSEQGRYHYGQITKLKQELQDARNGRDRNTKFGDKVPELLNRINRERHLFQGPVIGPLGAHVTMRDGCEQWSKALECALFTSLRSFVVTTVADRNRLFGLLKSLNVQQVHSIVLQGSGPRFGTNYPAMPGALNMVDALVIEEDLVFNCLLDQINMDRVALVESEEMITSRFVENVNGDDRLAYGLHRILSLTAVTVSYRGGNESSENCRFRLTGSLAKDDSEFIATREQNILTSQQEVDDAQRAQAEVNQRITAMNNEIRKVTGAIDDGQSKVRNLSRRKQELDSRLQEVQENGRVDTTDLEREAEALRTNINSLDFELEQAKAGIAAHEADLKTRKTELGHLERGRQDLDNQVEIHTKALSDFIHKCSSNEKRVEGLKTNLSVKRAALEAYETNVYGKEKAVYDEKVAAAQENTAKLVDNWDGLPMPLTDRDTKASLERKIKKLQGELDEGKKKANLEGYTAAILAERMETAKAAFYAKRQDFQKCKSNRDEMTPIVAEKKLKWATSFEKTVRKIKRAFDMYAQKQGATGTVDIDPNKEEMSLVVQMDAHDKKTMATDVRNLSGGERSYTTLCLLLALGHVTESPFRVMDEYDVFMDEGRRNDTLRSIQQHSLRADQFGRQIIVITPNTLASVKTGNSDQVRIHKMADPIKQSAHGLQQQTL